MICSDFVENQPHIMEELYSSQVLFYSLKPNFSFPMEFRLELDEQIDRLALQRAADTAISRYPYFRVKLVRKGESLCLADNPAPFLVYDDPQTQTLEPSRCNSHLLRIAAAGKLLSVYSCHGMADGQSFMSFLRTLLYYYWVEHHHTDSGMKEVLLAGEPIPTEEFVDPVLSLSNFTIDPAAAAKPYQGTPFALPEPLDPAGRTFVRSFTCSVKEMMAVSRKNDGSPNAMMLLFLSQAVMNLHPEAGDDILGLVAYNMRPAYRVKNAHQCCVGASYIPYTRRLAAMNFDQRATCVRGKIFLDSDPDRILANQAKSAQFGGYLRSLPTLEEKIKTSSYALSQTPRNTISISYIGKQDFGQWNNKICSFKTIARSEAPGLSVEISSFGDRFSFSIMKLFEDNCYINEVLRLMQVAGITCGEYEEDIVLSADFVDLHNLPELEET